MKNHVWFPISRGIAFMFCGRCGVIRLNNKVTNKVVGQPCKGRDEDDG